MTWTKDRPYAQGELEFHLTGLRKMQGEEETRQKAGHDEEWRQRRAQKLARRHGHTE